MCTQESGYGPIWNHGSRHELEGSDAAGESIDSGHLSAVVPRGKIGDGMSCAKEMPWRRSGDAVDRRTVRRVTQVNITMCFNRITSEPLVRCFHCSS
jgi:hypothetical protein